MSRVAPWMSVFVATCAAITFGDSSPAQAASYKLEMPKEAFGFNGTLVATVAKAPDKVYGWFEIQIVDVAAFGRQNKSKLKNLPALNKAWQGKYVAILGVKDMPELKVGDTVTVNAAVHEVHLRATKVELGNHRPAKPTAKPPVKN
ncbi:MAG: hypothetical protein JSS27_01345 [Planctomycetes bacterium]|nr:hypothetical protein [Planctomycetota bacterium]